MGLEKALAGAHATRRLSYTRTCVHTRVYTHVHTDTRTETHLHLPTRPAERLSGATRRGTRRRHGRAARNSPQLREVLGETQTLQHTHTRTHTHPAGAQEYPKRSAHYTPGGGHRTILLNLSVSKVAPHCDRPRARS